MDVDLNDGLAILLDNLIREVLEVTLEGLLIPLSTDKSPIIGCVVSELIPDGGLNAHRAHSQDLAETYLTS